MASWSVGRGKVCDIVLDYPTVSRRHATFAEAGDGIEIRDLGSTAGTHVMRDSDWVAVERITVAPDDPIRLGDYKTTARALLATAGVDLSRPGADEDEPITRPSKADRT